MITTLLLAAGAWGTVSAQPATAADSLAAVGSGATTPPLTVWDLGPQYGHYYWNSVNSNGEVAGFFQDYSKSTNGVPELLAASWLNGKVKTYGKTAGVANAIDDAGILYGASANPNDSSFDKYATRWTPSGSEIVDSSTGISADSMNGGFKVVSPNGTAGGMTGGSGCQQCAILAAPPDYKATIIHGGTIVTAVNDLGHALVVVSGAEDFYDGKKLVSTPLEYSNSESLLNGHDVSVGDVREAEGHEPPLEPATWHPGKTTILPTLAGTTSGNYDTATAINDSGTVVGNSSGDQALLWQGGKVVTLDSLLPKGSPWSLQFTRTLSNTGYVLGTGMLMGKAEYFLAKLPSPATVSGTVYDQQCGEVTCSEKALPHITVLVTGKDSDGAAVAKTNVSAADGSWSVTVPNGTYNAGPTLDGKTFAGPMFDPAETDSIKIDGQSVKNVNFAACTLGSGSSPQNSSDSLDSATVRGANSGYTAALCKTQYTITLSARIPGQQIVDPSLSAPYNSSGDPTHPSFSAETSKLGSLFYSRALDSLFETYPKYPACPGIYGETPQEQSETLETYAKHRVRMQWYSYMSGGNLGSVTAPMVFNQRLGDDGTVFFNGEPSQTTGQLTRTWVYKYISGGPDTQTHKCSITTPVSALALLTPGGNDRRGLVNENSFTLVVLWYVPFSPAGAVVPPGTSAEKVISGILGPKEGEEVVNTYEHMNWVTRFAFTATVGSAGVKTLEGAAALSKGLKGSAAVIARWQAAAEIAEKLHGLHSVYDVTKAAGEEVANLLSGEHYPIMGEVVRGTFEVQHNSLDKSLIASQTLGMSLAGSSFPDITMRVTREAKPNQDAVCPVKNGNLPWASSVAGCPYVYNPFSSNPPYMLSQSPGNLARGTAAVKTILARTKDLDPIEDEDIQSTGDVYEKLGAIQRLVNPPDCRPSAGPSTQQSRTMCWTFTDGRP